MTLSQFLLEDKKQEYKDYIEEHIKNTKKAWDLVQPKLKGEFALSEKTKNTVETLIKSHDASKYSEEEFEPYRQYFYPENDKEKNREIFDKAWQHHYGTNKHHWEHWNGEKIPLVYILELLCDWKAMSLKFGDTPLDYYNKNKGKMKIHPETKQTLEKWIKIF